MVLLGRATWTAIYLSTGRPPAAGWLALWLCLLVLLLVLLLGGAARDDEGCFLVASSSPRG